MLQNFLSSDRDNHMETPLRLFQTILGIRSMTKYSVTETILTSETIIWESGFKISQLRLGRSMHSNSNKMFIERIGIFLDMFMLSSNVAIVDFDFSVGLSFLSAFHSSAELCLFSSNSVLIEFFLAMLTISRTLFSLH